MGIELYCASQIKLLVRSSPTANHLTLNSTKHEYMTASSKLLSTTSEFAMTLNDYSISYVDNMSTEMFRKDGNP